jgi:hypothetical protein
MGRARQGLSSAIAEDGAPVVRRPAIDVARVLALTIVVMGHLSLAVIDRDGDEVRGANLFELRPGWSWLAVLAPMPIFFAAAGWANATSDLRSSAGRLGTLVGAGAAVVIGWSVAVIVVSLVHGSTGLAGRGARIATQPLWFLAAYVPLAASGAALASFVRRHVVSRVAVLLVVLGLLDVARFAGGAPRAIGWLGFLIAWGIPWILGSWWRTWVSEGGDEVRVGAALALVAGVAGWLLVAFGGYSAALIDAVPGARSNTTPPTLFTAMAGMCQVGVLMLASPLLDRVGRRWPALWRRASLLTVGVYVWHLTALALCVGVVALGVAVPDRLTVDWWLTRPLWWAAVLGVTALLIALSSALGHVAHQLASRGSQSAPARPGSDTALRVGVVTATAGAALVGLEGPRSVPLALVCSALFAAGWWLLHPHPTN